ncbi:MAG TPA: hypothetical protein VLG44_06145 [Chlamydiales bacterium]|nr:hypothetical protein [Chlamydiales bacterium]
MFINSINSYITSNHITSQETTFASVDFTHPEISAQNANVRLSSDAHYVKEKNCWSLTQHEGFFKIDVDIAKKPNKRYLLSLNHMDPDYIWDDDPDFGPPPRIKIKIGEQTVGVVIPVTQYQTHTIDLTPFLQDGENTIKLKKLCHSNYQIKSLNIVEESL